MDTDATTKNESDVSLQAKNPAKEEIKVAASNPFDALCDGDSGDDIINSAVEKLKKASVGSEPAVNAKNAKKGKKSQNVKEEGTSVVKSNNSNLKGGDSYYSNQNKANDQRGYGQGGASYYYNNNNRQQNGNYINQNSANGQRGYGQGGPSYYYNNNNNGQQNGNYMHQNRANGQRGYGQGGPSSYYNNNNRQQNGNFVHQNGNTTHQNGLSRGYSGKFSSRSSNGTEDGGSVKSDREQREEEFLRKKKQREEENQRIKKQNEEQFEQKLKDFKYDPKKEQDARDFVAKYHDTLAVKEAAIVKAQALLKQEEKHSDKESDDKRKKLQEAVNMAIKDKEVHMKSREEKWETIRLSEKKKMTLDEYEKMKEESKKASQTSKAEKRVVKSSDFDGLTVVVKKNVEDSLSLKPAVHKPVAKPKMEAEKTDQSKKMKKKAELELMMSFFSPPAGNKVRAGDRKNDGAPALESGRNFPGLHSASGP